MPRGSRQVSETLIEFGIGETRAIVVDGTIVEAHIERDEGWRAGDVREVRLAAILIPGVRGIVEVGGVEAVIEPLPSWLTDGVTLRVEVIRGGIAEAGRRKLAKVVATTAPERAGPDLAARLRARGLSCREVASHDPDRFEAAGWTETIESALSGHVAFTGGSLTISPTPGMTVIDVDGRLPPLDLAFAGAAAAAAAIARFDLAGSIGIDFPTVADKTARTAIGAVLDAGVLKPFERTSVNGFGFVQIVRPRHRASLIETLRADPAGAAALRLLRHAERSGGIGARTLTAAPSVIAWLVARPMLTADLARRRGTSVALHADPTLAIGAGHVAATP